MDYITAKEASSKWGMSLRQVQQYCANDKIPGVVRMGHQWMLPADAVRPADGRSLAARKSSQTERYHFPGLAFSKYYSIHDELSEDERLLLDAQLLNLKSELIESIRICKALISKAVSPSVKFGAYFTNASNYQVLGLAAEIPHCIRSMEEICQENPIHREDYRLLLAHIAFHNGFDIKPFLEIDVTKLSPESLPDYKTLSVSAAFFSNAESPEAAVRSYQAICREMDLLGIAPQSIVLHTALATFCSRKGDKASEELHIKEVCRIGYETGLLRLLSRAYPTLNEKLYKNCLCEYGNAFENNVEALFSENSKKWAFSYKIASGMDLGITSNLECEILLLLARNIPVKDIAVLKDLSEKEVRRIIERLRTKHSFKSRKELVEYYMNIFLAKTQN